MTGPRQSASCQEGQRTEWREAGGKHAGPASPATWERSHVETRKVRLALLAESAEGLFRLRRFKALGYDGLFVPQGAFDFCVEGALHQVLTGHHGAQGPLGYLLRGCRGRLEELLAWYDRVDQAEFECALSGKGRSQQEQFCGALSSDQEWKQDSGRGFGDDTEIDERH